MSPDGKDNCRSTAIHAHEARLGWREMLTNTPIEPLSLSEAVCPYRGGWCLEHDFHLFKDRPLGIRPLFVRRDEQIKGLTHLLLLALRLLTLIQIQVRHRLAEEAQTLPGLYEGQPNKVTDQPTGRRLLKSFARAQITLTRAQMGQQVRWHITPLNRAHEQILTYLKLTPQLYTQLAPNSS